MNRVLAYIALLLLAVPAKAQDVDAVRRHLADIQEMLGRVSLGQTLHVSKIDTLVVNWGDSTSTLYAEDVYSFDLPDSLQAWPDTFRIALETRWALMHHDRPYWPDEWEVVENVRHSEGLGYNILAAGLDTLTELYFPEGYTSMPGLLKVGAGKWWQAEVGGYVYTSMLGDTTEIHRLAYDAYRKYGKHLTSNLHSFDVAKRWMLAPEPPQGPVLIEAEAFDDSLATLTHAWEVQDSVVVALPNAGHNTELQASGPRLDYAISDSGLFYVWVLMYGETGSDDSIHLGVNGESFTLQGTGVYGTSGAWGWVGSQGSSRLTATFPGTLNLWMREDGVQVDKIILAQEETFSP